MAYGDFAFWYDALNTDADYERYAAEIVRYFQKYGVADGLIADLGCGTGDCTLLLAEAGYDMIAIDASERMLSVFRQKLDANLASEILLLCQSLEDLDLYGTIRGAVSTFDTLCHLEPAALREALRRVSLFMEPGGVLIFDANTLFKHRVVLGNSVFELEGEAGVSCLWENYYTPADHRVDFTITSYHDGEEVACESFAEYAYSPEEWERMLAEQGFSVLECLDGDAFAPLHEATERFLFIARKQ